MLTKTTHSVRISQFMDNKYSLDQIKGLLTLVHSILNRVYICIQCFRFT